jgi:hypothetical protein
MGQKIAGSALYEDPLANTLSLMGYIKEGV